MCYVLQRANIYILWTLQLCILCSHLYFVFNEVKKKIFFFCVEKRITHTCNPLFRHFPKLHQSQIPPSKFRLRLIVNRTICWIIHFTEIIIIRGNFINIIILSLEFGAIKLLEQNIRIFNWIIHTGIMPLDFHGKIAFVLFSSKSCSMSVQYILSLQTGQTFNNPKNRQIKSCGMCQLLTCVWLKTGSDSFCFVVDIERQLAIDVTDIISGEFDYVCNIHF